MNYCFQRKEKYLRIFTTKDLSKTIYYGDFKFIVNSSGIETNFSELKDLVAFLDSIKKCEISIEGVRNKQEEFNRYLKKNKDWK